jgi:hypothetical protein
MVHVVSYFRNSLWTSKNHYHIIFTQKRHIIVNIVYHIPMFQYFYVMFTFKRKLLAVYSMFNIKINFKQASRNFKF